MAQVYCERCNKNEEKVICVNCHLKTVEQVKELEAKVKKMNEFINAFDQLTKIKEKI